MQKPLLKWILRLGLAGGLAPSAAFALCDVNYVAKPGDNLFSISEAHFGDREHWKLIYERNQRMLAQTTVIPGRTLYIPCPEEEKPAVPVKVEPAKPAPQPAGNVELTLLTGGSFGPFSDPDLPAQGMVTELVNAALNEAPSPVSYTINWEEDWTKHLFPLLNQKTFDMGFPWVKPDCELNPQNERCVNFHFSDPVVTVPVMLFVEADRSFDYRGPEDLVGKTLCRPNGYFNQDADTTRRAWLDVDNLTVLAPVHPRECFALLQQHKVDAVAMNLFLGADTLVKEGLRGDVVPLEQPLAEIGLHVVISKRHWRGTSHLYRVNAGLKALRDNGQFDEILNRHLEHFWSQLQ